MTNKISVMGRGMAELLLAGALLGLLACGSTETTTSEDGANVGDGDGSPGDGDGSPGDGSGDGDGDGTTGPVDGAGDGTTGPGDGDGDGDTNPNPDADITFPMAVDQFFYVSGYSGDGSRPGLVTEQRTCPTRAGEQRGACHTFSWTQGPDRWVSIYWQYPANNWGGAVGRAIPAGAKRISFYAWGASGGEAVSFGAGIDQKDTFRVASPPFTLTREPKRYTLDLSDIDYGSDVISAFVWTGAAAPASGSLVFYVDDIVWETEPAEASSPAWPDGPGANNISLRVRNLCSFPLWIGGEGAGFALPGRQRVDPGQIRDYDAPKVWSSARVNAFKSENDAEPAEKAEMTFYIDGNGTNHLGYNVTYVDFVGLPLEIQAKGGACNRASHSTGCSVPESQIRSGCPRDFLRSGNRCVSPRSYCLAGRQGEPYCNALQSAIDACPSCPRGSTTEVYACSGPYAEEPRMCAALNRGMTGAPDDPDVTKYYQNGPFNDYAKWVHQVCPGIYAFSYDDWLSHGGFRDCAGGNEVRITFCPAG